MVIRSQRTRFWFRLTPVRTREPRNRWHPTATSLITGRTPLNVSGWVFRLSCDMPNRTGLARRLVRLERQRRPQRRRPNLRMAIRAPQRLFVPRRMGIHDGPVR